MAASGVGPLLCRQISGKTDSISSFVATASVQLPEQRPEARQGV